MDKMSGMRYITNCMYKLSQKMTVVLNRYSTRHSMQFISKHCNNKELVGAEIGVSHGAHSKSILNSLDMKMLYLIDPFSMYDGIDGAQDIEFDELYEVTKASLKNYKDKTKFIRKKSSDAVNDIPDNLDFIYIDGNHIYDFVKKDIEMYYPKVKKGGVICGHDFTVVDVAHAVTEFASKNNLKVSTGGYLMDWWFVKNGEEIDHESVDRK